ncbi:probable ubiquitin-like-specific protease 2A isoform X2 [Rhodamnia argentea]|uniref:Probable ubiquitin-like-specific protease 2A isoform X2 n=1 Tax=Rhodamnia argentea TaxID=178133 RepID=A0A8B8P9B3_9MYRT|nr:probable ubiquitin-like-specific protease 2A isoform X2 [Rhodamnia argentea]
MPKRKQREIISVDDFCASAAAGPNRRRNNNASFSKHPNKLDTNKFECCFRNIWQGLSEDKKGSFTFLDSLWFPLYMNESSREKVLKWIEKKCILSKKYVVIPIVYWGHWSLLILCHFGDRKSKNRTPCMILLDSLHMANPKRLEPEIRKFVVDIYKAEAKERPKKKPATSQIPLLVPKVPQQRNGEDCGRFVLYFTSLFVENAPKNFSTDDGYPYFMKEDWFCPQDLDRFCSGLIL